MPDLKITIGNKELTLEPVVPTGPNGTLTPLKWQMLLRYSREIYRWSCKAKYGRPDPRPEKFRVDPDLIFTNPYPGDAEFAPGQQPVERVDESLARLSRVTGAADNGKLQELIDALFGAQDLPIPWDKLLDPYAETTSCVISVREEYMRFYINPYSLREPRDGLTGTARRDLYLMVPLSVVFEAQITGHCGGNPEYALGLMRMQQVPVELNETGKLAAKVYQRALDRALFVGD